MILLTRKTVSQRDPRFAPAALCAVGAAVCMLVIATLYDVMAFPHGPCVFLYLAGLVAVVIQPHRRRAARGHPPPEVESRAPAAALVG